MAWFPLFLDLKERNCLIAGGGKTALHKAVKLLEAQVRLTVVAPVLDDSFLEFPIRYYCRTVRPEDVHGMTLVVDATGDVAAGSALAKACRENGIFFDAASNPEQGTALFPAVLRRGNFLAGISTLGASPAAAAWARDRLDEALPPRFDEILQQMQELRAKAKTHISQQEQRAAFLHTCLNAALAEGGPLTKESLEKIWRSVLNERD